MVMKNMILQSDCLETLKQIPDKSVNCCVTSPPYFGLRDYGHDGQIGLEETPEQFVQKLVEVFREVRRVLKDDGTLWLNLADSYANQKSGDTYSGFNERWSGTGIGGKQSNTFRNTDKKRKYDFGGCKPKDLIGVPWMVAFALRADGWWLRQDIIWSKPNPMPESVTDRCTKAHEYIFLLSKSAKYYYNADAIKEDAVTGNGKERVFGAKTQEGTLRQDIGRTFIDTGKRNKRSVWEVTTKPFKEAHFATFPEDLIVDCIKAGCPEDGIVLDPFGGAGTTAVVARKLNRNYILCELNPEYIDIAQKRIDNTLGLFA